MCTSTAMAGKLKATFSSWDAVADADPALVAEAVKSAGLAKQKVPRIQETLKRVRELTGDYDLREFVAERDPQTIALNYSDHIAGADGLTRTYYEKLADTLF